MRWWRHTALSRAVAFAILLWTAADLSNASLCALDQEGAGARPSASDTVIRCVAAGHDNPASRPGHIDDCFCCSHCVDASVFAMLDDRPLRLGVIHPGLTSALHSLAGAVDHPPQLLS